MAHYNTQDPVRWFLNELNKYKEIKSVDVVDYGFKTKVQVEHFNGDIKTIEMMQVNQRTMEKALEMVINTFDLDGKPSVLDEGTLFIV